MGKGARIALAAAVAGLSACASGPRAPAPPPLYAGGGSGSSVGNYAGHATGEAVTVPDGRRCDLFLWDRPLPPGHALRLRSASCAVPGRPGLFDLVDLGREVIPYGASLIPGQLAEMAAPLPADPVHRAAPATRVERAEP